jgi:hypothetical protein
MKLMVCHISAKERAEASHATTSTNDPSDPELLGRVDLDETVVDPMHYSETGVIIEDDPIEEKVIALADMICRAGDEPTIKSAALLVFMATLENAPNPQELANRAKHVAFIHCGALNVYGIVDAHIPVLESELFAAIL